MGVSPYDSVPVPVVGLTGGIASGKSTVAAMFHSLGVPCINADDLARRVVAPGSVGLERVINAFGEQYRNSTGGLDRGKLAEHVFNQTAARERLEQILHPLIRSLGTKELRELARAAPPYVLYEAALLVETGTFRDFAALVVVAAPVEMQLARLVARDGINLEEAKHRLEAQAPLEEKCAVADFVINNVGDFEATRRQVGDVDRSLREKFGSVGRQGGSV